MVVLIGFMGAGKTTVGQLLAERLELPFVDSDLVIEHRTGRSVREIFAERGEPHFRELEHQVVAELLAGPPAVVALGGGAVEHPGTRALLVAGQGTVVYLQVSWQEAKGRLGDDPSRPLLGSPGLAEIYRRRLAWYEQLATLRVPTDGRSPHEVEATILAAGVLQLPEGRASGAERASSLRPPLTSPAANAKATAKTSHPSA